MDLQVSELDVLQADVDDESPQVLAVVIDRCFANGALDAHLCPLVMKKNRPGHRIEVLSPPERREALVRLLLEETSTLGVKVRRVQRYALPRHFESVQLDGQTIQIKVADLGAGRVKAAPEFEDCRRVSDATGRPLRDVQRAAITLWEATRPADGAGSSE